MSVTINPAPVVPSTVINAYEPLYHLVLREEPAKPPAENPPVSHCDDLAISDPPNRSAQALPPHVQDGLAPFCLLPTPSQ